MVSREVGAADHALNRDTARDSVKMRQFRRFRICTGKMEIPTVVKSKYVLVLEGLKNLWYTRLAQFREPTDQGSLWKKKQSEQLRAD